MDENAPGKGAKSLRTLAKNRRGAVQQEQWKRRPESMRKQSNNNPEQDPMEPQGACAARSSAMRERRGSLQIVADSAVARRERWKLVAVHSLRERPGGGGDAALRL